MDIKRYFELLNSQGKTEKKQRILRGVFIATSVFLTFVITIYSLSWKHNRLVSLSPVAVWHGARIELNSLFEPKVSDKTSTHKEMAELIKDKLGHNQIVIVEDSLALTSLKVTQLSANLDEELNRAEESKKALNKTQAQLLDAKASANLLRSNTSMLNVYKAKQSQQQQAFKEATKLEDQLNELPSDEDANQLVAQRSQVKPQPVKGMSPNVLNNIQQTTGISPSEISELLNK